MIQSIVQFGLAAGFLLTWLGGACLILSLVLPNMSWQKIKDNNARPPSERFVGLNDDLLKAGNSPVWRLGQRILMAGSSTLIVSGIAWLALRIVEGRAIPG